MCTSGCPTKDHGSYGECLRAKNNRVAYCNSAGGRDFTAQKKWDKELDAYSAARAQGIQPSGTKLAQTQRAVELSDIAGKPYQANQSAL